MMVEVAQKISFHNNFGSIGGEGSRKHRIHSSPTQHTTESDRQGLQSWPRSESVTHQNEPPPYVDSSSYDDSSSDDDSIPEDPECLEVRLQTESIVNNKIRPEDTRRTAALDEDCITSITIVARNSANKTDTKLVVRVAGGIESVENFTKLTGKEKIAISVRTTWTYNKKLRAEIEQKWHAYEFGMNEMLPHIAYRVGEKFEQIDPKPDSRSITFHELNVKFVHTYQERKWYWKIFTIDGTQEEKVADIESNTQQIRPIQRPLPEFEKQYTKFSDPSFYLGLLTEAKFIPTIKNCNNNSTTPTNQQSDIERQSSGSASSASDGQSSIVATMSFTKVWHRDGGVKTDTAMIILSLGSETKFVTAKPKEGKMVVDARDSVFEFGQDYDRKKNYQWGIATCELDCSDDQLKILSEFIRKQGEIPDENKPELSDIACHMLYLSDPTTGSFVKHDFKEDTIRFKFSEQDFRTHHIVCYSHLPRQNAMHDYFCSVKISTYKKGWDEVIVHRRKLIGFLKTHSPALELRGNCPRAFMYPIIKFGVRFGAGSERNHVIFFSNPEDFDVHHKFTSDSCKPHAFELESFGDFLLDLLYPRDT